ncbi:MAG: patatin-like phospholipase family protein [Rhodocyclales bacterium]|nr:patatin-like phospholipase family protein [Rhodocyclales bacterium]
MLRLLLTSLLLLLSASAVARQTVGLVLGGGGARGAAHIGVLEVLEELRIPVDCVTGTSMGALVAGAYAGGLTPAAMREALAKADWSDMFIDNPDYSELSYRNKSVSKRFIPGSETGVGVNGVHYQGGMVAGQKIKLFFNQLVRSDLGERSIEGLPLPLSIIATDIGSGDRVVFRDGSLTRAMRASMSVPGLLAPVEYNGRKLVDGGLVDNLPIEEARQRCRPDVIIAINVGSPLLKPEEIGSMLSVSAQMVNILTEQNVTRSLAGLQPQDIYIRPDLEGITAGDFQRNAETADRGRKAAEELRERLRPLGVTEDEYRRWWRGIELARLVPPHIDEISVVGLKDVNPAALTRHLEQQAGEQIDTAKLNRNLLRAYGDGYYEGIDYELLSIRDRHVLRILPVEKPWGPDYVRVGVHLQSTLRRGSSYGLRAGYHRTWLNRLGGEFLVTGEIGTLDAINFDWYQPIEETQTFFVEPQFGYRGKEVDIFESDEKIAQYRFVEGRLGLMGGANIGRLGQIRVGWEQQHYHTRLEVGTPWLPEEDVRYGGWRVALDLDQKDRLHNATRGWAIRGNYFDSAKADYSKLEAEVQTSGSLGDFVVTGRFRTIGSPRGQLPYYDAGALGGFLNLSGFSQGQILGDEIRYGGLQAEKIIGRLPLGLRGDMRLGFALETGKASLCYTETSRAGWLNSGAIYIGGETPIGMLYLGFGRSNAGTSNLYLFVGTP